MKEYIVLLDIYTPPISATRFQKTFGVPAALFEKRKLKNAILWRVDSGLDGDVNFLKHVQTILKKCPLVVPKASKRRGAAYAAVINVGVMYDSFTCSIQVPRDCVDLLERHGVGMEITCYPTDFASKQIRRQPRKRESR